jgi:hypothetical protein
MERRDRLFGLGLAIKPPPEAIGQQLGTRRGGVGGQHCQCLVPEAATHQPERDVGGVMSHNAYNAGSAGPLPAGHPRKRPRRDSRNRSRRFCSNACASRTTVAAYRARRKAADMS